MLSLPPNLKQINTKVVSRKSHINFKAFYLKNLDTTILFKQEIFFEIVNETKFSQYCQKLRNINILQHGACWICDQLAFGTKEQEHLGIHPDILFCVFSLMKHTVQQLYGAFVHCCDNHFSSKFIQNNLLQTLTTILIMAIDKDCN